MITPRNAGVVLAIAGIVLAGDARSQWVFNLSQNVGGGCQRIETSHFFNGSTGVAGGCNSFSYATGAPRIRKTTTGGLSWTTVYSGTAGSIWAMDFADASIGVASVVADGGSELLRTTNAGDSWAQVDDGTDVPFHTLGLHFPTALIGYAVGDDDGIAKTTDAGLTWSVLPDPLPGNSQQLLGVFFTSATTGYATGDHGWIYHTTNGGTSWDSLSTGVDGLLSGLYFQNTTTGFAYGGINSTADAVILRTTNAGDTWTPMAINASGTLRISDMVFSNASVGFAGDLSGAIYRTGDGGLTWDEDFPINVAITSMYSISVAGSAGYGFGWAPYFVKNGTVTGIEEMENGSGLSVWPIPFNGSELTLASNGQETAGESLDVRLTDAQGRSVHHQLVRVPAFGGPINMSFGSKLTPGVYTLILTTDNRSWAQRVLVE